MSAAVPQPALGSVEGVEFALDAGSRALFSQDIYARAAQPVSAVARPLSIDALQRLVERAAATGTPLLPRGGGMSYTDGYLPKRANSIMVDMLRMNRVVTVDVDDEVPQRVPEHARARQASGETQRF